MGAAPRCSGVVIRVFGDDWNFGKVFSGRRRRRGPFEAFGAPRVGSGDGTVFEGPDEIDQRDQIADAEDGSSGGRHDVENLKFAGIDAIAAGHAEITQNEL